MHNIGRLVGLTGVTAVANTIVKASVCLCTVIPHYDSQFNSHLVKDFLLLCCV